ncbi:FkbM family methyltransferase [Bacillus sp. JJ1521]|uniref:FkbM family methyltransferase n=1 Tax=Bacillus sp. JJ1521 TaxID=3122957 RepID=UPI002FFF2D4B
MVRKFSLEYLRQETNQIDLLISNANELLNKQQKPIILFGTGIIGKINLAYCKKYCKAEKILFCDNDSNKWGSKIDEINVISFEELVTKYRESYIIISTFQFRDEIYSQLLKSNLEENIINPSSKNVIVSETPFYEVFKNYYNVVKRNKEKFTEVFNMLSDDESKDIFYERINYCITANNEYLIPKQSTGPQYFDPEVISFSNDEIFIDGGAYIGDTVEGFLKAVNGKYKKIYAFEPEDTKHQEFFKRLSSHNNIELKPFGLWKSNDVLRFSSENSGSSQVTQCGNIEIPVVSIDETLMREPVTFIKMDIEGAEIEALKGAEKTIKKYKPKLAICVYHKPLDLIEIPLYLKSIVPEYSFKLRHYNNSASETVCYAVVK